MAFTGEIIFQLFTAKAAEHLWFFRPLIEFYVLYPIIIRIYLHFEAIHREKYLLRGALAVQVFISFLVMSDFVFLNKYHLGFLNLFLAWLGFIFYFLLGIFVNRNYKAVLLWIESLQWKRIGLILVGSVLCMSLLTFDHHLGHGKKDDIYRISSLFVSPVIYFLCFVLCFRFYQDISRDLKNSFKVRIVSALGKYSYGIYLIHIMFMGILVRILNLFHLGRSDYLFYLLLFPMTLLLSYSSVVLINRTPFSRSMIGMSSATK